MDLTTGWDFDKGEDRRRAVQTILTEKPNLLVGSPECTLFSMLQELNLAIHTNDPTWIAHFELRLEKAKRHIRFCCKLYKLQMSMGRYWLHEHPWLAKSWDMKEVRDILADPRTMIVRADQCQFGLTAPIGHKDGPRGPAQKPTGFMGNSWCIMEQLDRRCKKDHQHVHLMEGKAKGAAIYTPELCATICQGLKAQKEYDAKNRRCSVSMSKCSLEEALKRMVGDAIKEVVD